MRTGPIAARTANPLGRSFALALGGAALGVLGLLGIAAASGFWILLLALPLFLVFLAASGLISALLTAVFARLSTRRFSGLAVALGSAILTLLIFATLPLYFIAFGSTRPGGLLFG